MTIEKYLPRSKWVRSSLFLVFDVLMTVFCAFLALWVRFDLSVSAIPHQYVDAAWTMYLFNIAITMFVFCAARMYSTMWGSAGVREIFQVTAACLIASAVQMAAAGILKVSQPRSYYLLWFVFMTIFIGISRLSFRIVRVVLFRMNSRSQLSNRKRVMIVGGGQAGAMLIRELKNSDKSTAEPVCVIDDDRAKIGRYISGVPVKGSSKDIPAVAERLSVDEIYVAIPSASAGEKKRILELCQKTGVKIKILPGIYQLASGEVNVTRLRKVEIEDLLGREPVSVNLDEIMGYVQGKVALVTGGGGSIGSELCRQLADHGVKQLIIFDMYENNAYEIQQELRRRHPELNLVVLIGSVRNTRRLESVFRKYRPDIVYHAAAHKHVPLMEDSPNESIKNNVIGTYKTARAAIQYGTERFILISTDKAVNPTNIMGASKRLCEMVIQMCNQKGKTKFVAVRFGNVLGSNGSVIPLFKQQIEEGGPVTVTHKDIIRYFMTIPEAVSLVLQAGAYGKGGEIFVLNMGEPVRILDMAENLIRLSGYEPYRDIQIQFTGLRPGEKLYEELLMDEEGLQTTSNKRIFIGHPIEMDYEKFERRLMELDEAAWMETDDIRRMVHELVPEYWYDGCKVPEKENEDLERESLHSNLAAVQAAATKMTAGQEEATQTTDRQEEAAQITDQGTVTRIKAQAAITRAAVTQAEAGPGVASF